MRRAGSWMKRRSVAVLDKHFTGHTLNYKIILAMIAPIFVDQAFLVLMSLLNTAMISSSGVAAISAVSMVDSLNIFIVSVFVAVATGGTVIVAQYRGSGNDAMVSKSAAQAISVATLLSLIVTVVVVVFPTGILNLLFGEAEADVMSNARVFLIGNAVTYPLFAMYQAIVGALRGVAETKATLVLSLIMNLLYFGLNFVFVILLEMGVSGLVVSLIVSRVVGVATSFLYLIKINQTIRFAFRDALEWNGALIKKMMSVGFPFALEQMFFNGGKLLTQTFIVKFGTLALTVNAISNSISMLSQIGATTLSIAVVTVVGQCIGGNHKDDARKFTRSFIGLSVGWFVFAALLILPLFPYIVQLFSPPQEIVPSIFNLILLISITQPLLWSFSFVLPAALRAAGDSKFTSMTAMATMWLIRVILGYVLGVTLNYGVMGIWIAMVIEWGVRGALFWWRFRGEQWYRHKLI